MVTIIFLVVQHRIKDLNKGKIFGGAGRIKPGGTKIKIKINRIVITMVVEIIMDITTEVMGEVIAIMEEEVVIMGIDHKLPEGINNVNNNNNKCKNIRVSTNKVNINSSNSSSINNHISNNTCIKPINMFNNILILIIKIITKITARVTIKVTIITKIKVTCRPTEEGHKVKIKINWRHTHTHRITIRMLIKPNL